MRRDGNFRPTGAQSETTARVNGVLPPQGGASPVVHQQPESLPMIRTSLILLIAAMTQMAAAGQEQPPRDLERMTRTWFEANPYSLPHWLTPEEQGRLDEVGRDFYETDPPPGVVRNIAEFERMEGVLIRYPFGITTTLIAEMSQDITVTTIVTGPSQENTVRNTYDSAGVNLDNCNFIHAPSNSYWTRDYGPWYVMYGTAQVGIVNFPYNRPRPDDNDIPIRVSEHLGIELFGMNLIHTGGNWMCDGMGIASSSELVWEENPSLSHVEIEVLVDDYLGIGTYHVIPDPNGTYIDHIDCWGKFLDTDKVLIRSVPAGHSQYDEIEATAAYYESQLSAYGSPYEVYRVYTPNDQPYTNSLILNEKVLVPITGSSWDDDALATYEAAMPGYEVLGFTGSWVSTDALHCRAKGIADTGLLHIRHAALWGEQPVGTPYAVDAEIVACSGQALDPDSLLVYYSVNGAPFSPLALASAGGDSYTAAIPAQVEGAEVAYYIHAADASGRSEDHPFIGAPDPHRFTAGAPVPPELSVSPFSFDVVLEPDAAATEYLYVSNIGGGSLDYDIVVQNPGPQARDVTGSSVTCSAAEYMPGETTTWTMEVYNGSVDNEWLEDVEIDFPAGVTVLSSTDFTGGSGGPMETDGATGDGAVVHWHGEDGSGWGVVYPGESAFADVQVAIDAALGGDLVLDWQIDGDVYGDPPHSITGQTVIYEGTPPVTWITVNPESGSVPGGETDTVAVDFDAAGLEEGLYTCELAVNGEVTIPVTLEVLTQVQPSPPENLVIAVAGDTVLLSWDAVPGATGYRVYSSTEPYQAYAEDLSGIYDGASWSAPRTAGSRFYLVTALIE